MIHEADVPDQLPNESRAAWMERLTSSGWTPPEEVEPPAKPYEPDDWQHVRLPFRD